MGKLVSLYIVLLQVPEPIDGVKGLTVHTLCDVCTVTKSPNDTFLRKHPVIKRHKTVYQYRYYYYFLNEDVFYIPIGKDLPNYLLHEQVKCRTVCTKHYHLLKKRVKEI